MEVYILVEVDRYDYEHFYIHGAYSSEEKAMEEMMMYKSSKRPEGHMLLSPIVIKVDK